ncbi:BnaCnng43960D [Brassica napus]|uniref:BnaCnng43960D protein n=1 Tax=Brassica napus TaxID=3708 RepID=A0A078JDM3_BRANA|nr:BnaCnng43960D [Brassica napus]
MAAKRVHGDYPSSTDLSTVKRHKDLDFPEDTTTALERRRRRRDQPPQPTPTMRRIRRHGPPPRSFHPLVGNLRDMLPVRFLPGASLQSRRRRSSPPYRRSTP